MIKKHTHTRIVTQHHYHKVPNSLPSVLPIGEIDSESAGSWNNPFQSIKTDSNNDWSLMQAALNPDMDFHQFQNLKNKLKQSNFNLEDYENMKESIKTGEFLKPRPEFKMSLDDMLNRFQAEQKMKEDQSDAEASDSQIYALHKLAKLNAEFLEKERQKEIMGTITAPEITASDYFTPSVRPQKRHQQQKKFQPSQEYSTYQQYEDPADDIYPTRHSNRYNENNDYTSEHIRHPTSIPKSKQKYENKNKFNYMKNENFDEATSYSHNKWLPVQKPRHEQQQSSYGNWGDGSRNVKGKGSNRFSTHDSTSTDDNDMDEIMNFSSFDNSFNENLSNIPKIIKNKKRNQRPKSSVYVAKVFH